MPLIRVDYSKISEKLRQYNIFFTTNGTDRHKPSDILQIMSNVTIEPYCAFLGG
ncbi:MAG: hypothetical protein LBG21_00310 [Campylobacteraceae bacterium]|jgi:hypothetical protein|nr:hypothetical protein [Campylobacteraceae bacterium]